MGHISSAGADGLGSWVLGAALKRAHGLLALIGLREGDVLQTVNGFDVANPERALEAFARLRVAPQLDVRVEREGRPLRIDYSIE